MAKSRKKLTLRSKRAASKPQKETTTAEGKRSLADYQRDKTMAERRSTCLVCQLPDSVRGELRTARSAKIPRLVMLEWLNEELGYEITNSQLDVHGNGKHDLR